MKPPGSQGAQFELLLGRRAARFGLVRVAHRRLTNAERLSPFKPHVPVWGVSVSSVIKPLADICPVASQKGRGEIFSKGAHLELMVTRNQPDDPSESRQSELQLR